MPTTYGDYTYAFADDLREEQCVSKARKSFPFEGDSSNYILEEDYMVFIEYYDPPAPSARHPEYSNVFFIKDTPISDVGNGTGRFTRTWATLPGMTGDGKLKKFVRTEYESHVLTVPGIGTAQTGLFQDMAVLSTTVSGGKHYITTDGSHGIAVGKLAAIKYYVKDPLSKITRNITQVKVALTGTTGALLVVDEVKDVNTVDIRIVARSGMQTPSRQRVVNSRVDYTYYLPGVNINSENDIPIIQQLEIFNYDETVNAVSDVLTETTSPTIDEYLEFVRQGEWFCAEATTLARWQGEIVEAKTRFCKYQL